MGYIIRSREHFYVNGVKSTDVGLNVEFLQPVPMAAQRYTQWTTGADMDSSTPDDSFENIPYNIEARVLRNPSGFDSSDIYALFANAQTISLSTVPGYYYKIRKVLGITPSAEPELRGNSITYLISLELAPFKYMLDNSEVSVDSLIENPGNRYSRPLYKITGRTAGATVCNLIVNGKTFSMKNLADSNATIFIDADRMLVYDQSNTNLIMKTDGQLPFLAPGINTVSVSDGALSVIGNWRSY